MKNILCHHLHKFLLLGAILSVCVSVQNTNAVPSLPEVDTVTYIEPPQKPGSRLHYEEQLLRLAMEKTKAVYGGYRLNTTPDTRTTPRHTYAIKHNRIKNFVRSFAVDKKLLEDEDLLHIEFPMMRGSSSYRICFTSKKNTTRVAQVKSLQELAQLSFVQGLGWPDKEILEHAGFKVFESGKKRTIFEMVAHGRADLFCRGVGEYKSEWDRYKDDIENLVMDEHLLIFFPFPRYFFSHRSNQRLIERLALGLNIAQADGSFIQLWNKYHGDAIKDAKLDKRQLFVLENPALKNVVLNYSQYFYPIGTSNQP